MTAQLAPVPTAAAPADLEVPDHLRKVRSYVARGWRVFPCHRLTAPGVCSCRAGDTCTKSKGKHPCIKGYAEAASSDWRQVLTWDAEWDHPNWAIKCDYGREGFVVLDVDPRAGGFDSLRQLVDRHGALPTTPVQLTGGGGLHFAFWTDARVKTATRLGGLPGLDLRAGDGNGYIIVDPSNHHSGGAYEFQHEGHPVAPMPAWLESLGLGARVAFDFRAWLERQPPAVEGDDGSKVAFRVACRAVESGITTAAAFVEAVRDWNAACAPPWTEEELVHKFTDAQRRLAAEGADGRIPRVEVPGMAKGKPTMTEVFLRRVLTEDPAFVRIFRKNVVRGDVYLRGALMTDASAKNLGVEIATRYGCPSCPATEVFREAEALAEAFNPVQEYLERLPAWDGVPRWEALATFLDADLGVDPLAPVYLRRWGISAVARALQPGCKVDTVLVLCGRQGFGKSSFLRILAAAAGPEMFRDTAIDLRSKDGYLQLGCWVYEWAELEDTLRSHDAARVKSFLSSPVDVYRAPYARVTMEHPRHCVVVASSNEVTSLLADPTGSRRFWPLTMRRDLTPVEKTQLEALRDVLWAEALARYRAGEPWWLTREEEDRRRATSEAYSVADTLAGAVLDYAERQRTAGRGESLTFGEVCLALGRDATRLTPTEVASISGALRDAGYAAQPGKRKAVWVRRP